ncbi:hypothetical protein GBN23_06685 [Plesiomonas shigelloides]|uniref:hypothetical protein n=1 Tax=Plesiomonas shigelloides TaxID=703 RepID=UPI0012629F7D|nr:hypothetical protein [Plesiomonas shigelloides]KAB7679597.1 hypothetical protein GBN23_06685 [Plesiomonas shigelloides]
MQEDNAKILQNFIEKYKVFPSDEVDDIYKKRINNVIKVLVCINQNKHFFDLKCGFSIASIGSQFIKSLERGTKDLTSDELDNIYCYCFKFLCEVDYADNDISIINENMHSIKNCMFTDILENKGPAFHDMMSSLFVLPGA